MNGTAASLHRSHTVVCGSWNPARVLASHVSHGNVSQPICSRANQELQLRITMDRAEMCVKSSAKPREAGAGRAFTALPDVCEKMSFPEAHCLITALLFMVLDCLL